MMTAPEELVKEWMSGIMIAQMSYAAGFVLRLEREIESEGLPSVLLLDIKSKVIFDNKSEWEGFISSLPMQNRRGEYDEHALALRLFLSIGASITMAEIIKGGVLLLETSDNETIRVSGTDDAWDDSWSLSVPEDVPHIGPHKYIVCLKDGHIDVASGI